MNIQEPWLYHIQQGTKKIEGRRGNEKKYEHLLGQIVCFYNDERTVFVKVIELHHYKNLYDYFDAEIYSIALPGIDSYEKAVDTYYSFYVKDKSIVGAEKIKLAEESIKEEGGIVAIIFELIKN